MIFEDAGQILNLNTNAYLYSARLIAISKLLLRVTYYKVVSNDIFAQAATSNSEK